MKKISTFISLLFFVGCSSSGAWLDKNSEKVSTQEHTLFEAETITYNVAEEHFSLSANFTTQQASMAVITFGNGYEVMIANGPSNGSLRTGSLSGIRNIYKSTAKNEIPFSLVIDVKGKNISIKLDSTEIVNYTQPEMPMRLPQNKNKTLGKGVISIKSVIGILTIQNLKVEHHNAVVRNDGAVQPMDEQTNPIAKLQQNYFPVIDYHIHLKSIDLNGAWKKSCENGISYGIAPNCGIGFAITSDDMVKQYRDTTSHMPFFFGMQGEGREWVSTFSPKSRAMFDYVFTDAMTFLDHKNRRTRLWVDSTVVIDISKEQYMDLIVDKIVKVINEEPINIYVNPAFLPKEMADQYDKFWTDERINRVTDVLRDKNVALEINARYRIPNFR
ncbi:MAG: hypothetical protein RR141_00130, partial [Rikenellaceae bacterium]